MFIYIIATVVTISIVILICQILSTQRSTTTNYIAHEVDIFNSPVCDAFYLRYKIYYDTINVTIFDDYNLRDQLFPNFKRVYSTIDSEDTILDIGSNIGDITAMFHDYYQQNRIYLAEPLELNCDTTRQKFSAFPQIQTVHTAIGLNYGFKTFEYKNAGDMMIKKRNLRLENIPFMSLDFFYESNVKSGNVFFLKIDVEGYEDEVLFTGKNLLASGKIKYIYFEYHRVNNIYCKTSCSSLVSFLEQYGYNCYLVGKFKIIRITKGCFMTMDQQKLAHVIAIKENLEMQNKFVNTYNELYERNAPSDIAT